MVGLITGRSGKYKQISTLPLPLPMVLNGGSFLYRVAAILCFLAAAMFSFLIAVMFVFVGASYTVLFNAVIAIMIPLGLGIFFARLSGRGAAFLRLDQEGFTARFLSRERRVRWDSVEYFKVVRPGRIGSQHRRLLVGWRYKAGFQSPYPSRVRRFTKNDVDDYLRINYGEYPGDLEQLLNELRDRHGSHSQRAQSNPSSRHRHPNLAPPNPSNPYYNID